MIVILYLSEYYLFKKRIIGRLCNSQHLLATTPLHTPGTPGTLGTLDTPGTPLTTITKPCKFCVNTSILKGWTSKCCSHQNPWKLYWCHFAPSAPYAPRAPITPFALLAPNKMPVYHTEHPLNKYTAMSANNQHDEDSDEDKNSKALRSESTEKL